MDPITIITVLTHVVAVASAVCALTPTPKKDGIIKTLYQILDVLAMNIGKAKDK